MPNAANSGPARPNAWFAVVLRDEHFWIPLLVLVGGLMVLRWIA